MAVIYDKVTTRMKPKNLVNRSTSKCLDITMMKIVYFYWFTQPKLTKL